LYIRDPICNKVDDNYFILSFSLHLVTTDSLISNTFLWWLVGWCLEACVHVGGTHQQFGFLLKHAHELERNWAE
jgi:hypothetical protein